MTEKQKYQDRLDKIEFLENRGWREAWTGGWFKQFLWVQPKDSPVMPLEVAYMIEKGEENGR